MSGVVVGMGGWEREEGREGGRKGEREGGRGRGRERKRKREREKGREGERKYMVYVAETEFTGKHILVCYDLELSDISVDQLILLVSICTLEEFHTQERWTQDSEQEGLVQLQTKNIGGCHTLHAVSRVTSMDTYP